MFFEMYDRGANRQRRALTSENDMVFSFKTAQRLVI
jgi:hypothetical protein